MASVRLATAGPLTPAPGLAIGMPALAMLVACAVVVPCVEEYLFRGWLQSATAAELPAAAKRWAFALAAGAFALAHVGGIGLPQLLLGLVTGAMVAAGAGIGPAIVCHGTYNALLLLHAV